MARAKQHTADWDERFRSEDVPWEDDAVAPAVVRLFETFVPRPVTVLEIGCGLGTTAAWLAGQGHTVTACDISAEAISVASARAMRESLQIRWIVADALRGRAELPQVDVVFTRGVLHTFRDHKGRKAFAEAIAETQTPGTPWLDVSGSADTPNDPQDARRRGFPRLTLTEITCAVEPLFEVLAVGQVEYGTTPGLTDFLPSLQPSECGVTDSVPRQRPA